MKDALCLIAAAVIFFVAVEAHSNCPENNWDYFKVTKARQQGMEKETLLDYLESSRSELTEDRMERIRGIIDEVYKLEQVDAQNYFEKHHMDCDKAL